MLDVNRIYTIDALDGLKKLDDYSVDCVLTSPPYWATRDYGISPRRWSDGTESVLGLEPTCELYVAHLLEVFDEVKRVLKSSGTLWVNLGDVYGGKSMTVSHAKRSRGENSLLPEDLSYMPAKGHVRGRWSKCLMAVPERFVLAMLQRGWILRNRICWFKPNHMPESVKDRFTSAWEHLLFFTKSRKYYFDLDAVREPHACLRDRPGNNYALAESRRRPSPNPRGVRLPPLRHEVGGLHGKGKNPGDYWPTSPETRRLGAILGLSGATKVPGGSG